MRPSDHVAHHRHTRGWTLYADALIWVANAKPEWRQGNGRPDLLAIGADTGPSYTNLARISSDPGCPVTASIAIALAEGAAEAYNMPFKVAFYRICQDPSQPKSKSKWFGKNDTPDELIAAFIRHIGDFARTPGLADAVAA